MNNLKILFASLGFLLISGPAVAVNLTNETPSADVVVDDSCRTLEAELAEAAQYKWSVVKTLTGAEAAEFIKKYNSIPPVSNEKGAMVQILAKDGIAHAGILIVDEKNCVKKRFFLLKSTLAQVLGVTV